MASQLMANIAKPVFVYGLTHTLGDAFAPFVTKLAGIAPAAGAASAVLQDAVDRRVKILTDAVDQYGGRTPIKPEDLKQPKATTSETTAMLTGPWDAVWKQLHGSVDAIAEPYHSFATAAMQRAGLSGLPARDVAMLNNVLLMLTLGALSYWADGRTDADPKAWAAEATSRSGVIEILASGDHVIKDATTANKTMSHSEADLTRKVLPMQNLFYVRKLFDAAGNGFKHAFGIQLAG